MIKQKGEFIAAFKERTQRWKIKGYKMSLLFRIIEFSMNLINLYKTKLQ